MSFKLADLFVQITGDAKPLSSTLVLVQQQLMGMSGTGGQLGASIASAAGPLLGLSAVATAAAGAIAIAATAGVLGLAKAAAMAGHLTEAINKSEQVFGSSNGKIIALADEMARKFGIVKTTVLDTSASFGLMFEGAGIGREKAADMSAALMKLSGDASRFFDMPIEQAIARMTSGLSGEMEAVRRWGVNLSEVNVHQKAVTMGLAKAKEELDQSTKTMVRYQLILEGLKPASGALERESGGLTAQWSQFTGQLENLITTVGIAVMPAFTLIMRGLNGLLIFITPVIEKWSEFATVIADIAVPAIVSGVQSIWSVAGPVLGFMRDSLLGIYGIIKLIIGGMAEWYGGIADLTGLSYVYTAMFGASEDPEKAKADRIKSVDDRIKKSTDSFAADSEAAKKAGAKTPKGFQGGLEEYARKVQESSFSSGKDDTAKKTLSAAERTAKATEEMAGASRKADRRPEPAFAF